jgi:hypothetical protein
VSMMPPDEYPSNRGIIASENRETVEWPRLTIPMLTTMMLIGMPMAQVEEIHGCKYCLFLRMRYMVVFEELKNCLFLILFRLLSI